MHWKALLLFDFDIIGCDVGSTIALVSNFYYFELIYLQILLSTEPYHVGGFGPIRRWTDVIGARNFEQS